MQASKITLKYAKIAGFILLNSVVIAVLLEIVLRLSAPLLPEPLQVTARRVTTGQAYAEVWSPAWQQNRDHYYALRPGLDNALQYGSANVSFRLSTIELWAGAGIGVRNRPVNYRVDAVVVGDSFGLCFTERADCWVNRLQAQTGLGIVNLSQPVTGTTSHLRMLQGFGAPMEPPLVIWQFFGNDFNDDYGLALFRDELDELHELDELDELDDPLPPDTPFDDAPPADTLLTWLQNNSVAYAVTEQVLTGQWGGLPAGEREFVMRYSASYGDNVLYFGAQYEQRALDMASERNQIGYELSRQAFAAAQQTVAEWGGEIVVVMIPTREEVYRELTEPLMGAAALDRLASARAAMHDLCDALALRCLDPLEVFRARAAQNEALYYSDDMHLNPHGNAVLAAWLASELGF